MDPPSYCAVLYGRPPGDSSVAAHPLHIKLMKEHPDVGEPTTPYNSHPDRSPPYHNHNHNHGTQGQQQSSKCRNKILKEWM